MLVDEGGAVYWLMGDTLHLLAESFETALHYIVQCEVSRREVDRDLGGVVRRQWDLEPRS